MEGSLVAYKVFTNGSVLNASEINENLMQQSTAVFSNAAARTAAITSPVEGQVTYLEDVNSYQSYNGSAWVGLVPQSSNIIINGAFEINQREYVSAANLASGAFGFDRWKSNFTNTTLTYTSAPQGQELTSQSKIIFRKDMNRSRDMEIREQTLKEIMDNRKVSRKEAEMILADPM